MLSGCWPKSVGLSWNLWGLHVLRHQERQAFSQKERASWLKSVGLSWKRWLRDVLGRVQPHQIAAAAHFVIQRPSILKPQKIDKPQLQFMFLAPCNVVQKFQGLLNQVMLHRSAASSKAMQIDLILQPGRFLDSGTRPSRNVSAGFRSRAGPLAPARASVLHALVGAWFR